jgi:hypothetical protein
MDMKNIVNKAKDVRDQAKEAGKEKIQEAIEGALNDLQGLRPILGQCGYSLGDIRVSITLPPNIVVAIMHDHEAAASLEEIAARPDLTNLQSLVVKALKNAYGLSGMFKKYGYVIGQLSLELGLIPKVGVVLTNAK